MNKFKAAASAVTAGVKISNNSAECVKVVVRCRPLSSKEVEDGRQRIVEMDTTNGQITIKNPKAADAEPPRNFTFDLVYDWNTQQKAFYLETAAPIVENVMEGYNGTVFAYGQTGTGKTHTMEGKEEPEELQGVIPRTFRHVFDNISKTADKEFLVRASFLEIYNEDIRDLLAKNAQNRLELKETVDSGVFVKDLTSFVVKGVAEINNVLGVGRKNRTVGATLMNQDSSRSHSIFTVTIECSEKSAAGSDDDQHIRVGKLNLVDLAGSERQSKTGATGDRLKEATKINLSLSALGNVISSLVDGKSGHIPYRDSKLTRLLQDSLGGNTKTVMVANMGPADYNFDETISTLRYANRAKNIKNKPRINEDPKDAMLREFQDEIKRLKAQLDAEGGVLPAEGGDEGADDLDDADPGEDEVVEVEVEKEKELEGDEMEQIMEQARVELEKKLREDVEADQDAIEAARAEAEAKAADDLNKLLEDKTKTEEQKAQIAAAMEQKQAELKKKMERVQTEKVERKNLQKKLKAMEAKLVTGSADFAAQVASKDEELQRRELEIVQKKQEDARRFQQIQHLEEQQISKEEQYSSLEEEAEIKTKKLNKLFAKYKEAKNEINDINEEQQREREDMLDTIRTLTRQMRLKDLIIENFVPREEMEKVKRRAHWEEDMEQWVLERLCDSNSTKIKRPISASQQKRPTSDYAKIASAMGDQNPRFKSENILNLELDMPERTTYDYEGPGMNVQVQAALNAAFADEGETLYIASDNMPNVVFSGDGDKKERRQSSRPGSAKPKREPREGDDSENSGTRQSSRRESSRRRESKEV